MAKKKTSKKKASTKKSTKKKSTAKKASSKKSTPKKNTSKKKSAAKKAAKETPESTTSKKKASSKKSATKKSSAKKAEPKKSTGKKASTKKSSAKKSAKKTSTKKAAANKSKAKKSSAKKAEPKKAAKKTTPKKSKAKKTAPKKTTPKKTAKKGTAKKAKTKAPAKSTPKAAPKKVSIPKADLAFIEFEIPMDKIVLGDHQPRSRESIEARGSITQLKNSIREVGLLQPILVQAQDDGTYMLISGERRYRSCTELGHKKIRAVLPSNRTVHALNERGKTLDELALFENLQRKNLTAIEEARCFKKLLKILELTQEELGERLDLKQAYISERIGFLNLPAAVQNMIEDGEITSSQARELGRLREIRKKKERESKQIELAGRLRVEKITVRTTKKMVDDMLGKKVKRDGAQLTRLGAKKAVYFISTLNEKFDEIDLTELDDDDNEEKLVQLHENLPTLIKKLQGLKKKVAKLV